MCQNYIKMGNIFTLLLYAINVTLDFETLKMQKNAFEILSMNRHSILIVTVLIITL